MKDEDLEPLEDWIQRMQKLINNGKPYAKEERLRKERDYYEMCYSDAGTALLTQFLLKWHPQLQNAHPDFAPYIKELAQKTFTKLLHRFWENVSYNREGKNPRDIPELDFDNLLELLKKMREREPSLLTEQDMNSREYSRFDENDKKELMKDINDDNMRRWKFLSGYTSEFIGCMQPLFFNMWHELMEMESDWWLLYEYDMLSSSNSFRDYANIIERVHSKGFEAKLLDEKLTKVVEKLSEIKKNS